MTKDIKDCWWVKQYLGFLKLNWFESTWQQVTSPLAPNYLLEPDKCNFSFCSAVLQRKAVSTVSILPLTEKLYIIVAADVETACIPSRIRHHITYTVECLIPPLGIALEPPVFLLVLVFCACFAPCLGVRDKTRHKAVEVLSPWCACLWRTMEKRRKRTAE